MSSSPDKQVIHLDQADVPLAVLGHDFALLGITPQGAALLSRLGVDASEGLPDELQSILSDTPYGRAAIWRPLGLASDECLGFTPYRYGADQLLLLMREVSEKQRQLSERVNTQINDSISRLVSMTTAELRIALTTVFFNADVLCDEHDSLSPTDVHDLLRGIRTGAEHLGLTIDHLADLARLGPPARVIFSLQRITERIQRLIRPILRDRRHRFDARLGEQEHWIIANPFRAQEILLNVAVNAFEATDRPTCLTIEVARIDRDENASITLRVRDDGPGIAPAMHRHVFDPYFTTKENHRGMGLTHARTAIREIGGDLVLEPATEGASFLLTFPYADAPTDIHDDRAHS